MKRVGYFVIFLVFMTIQFIVILPSFATDVKIADYHYLTHWTPGEDITFSVAAKNNDLVINEIYFSAVLTNLATGSEVAPYPTSVSTVISAGATSTLTATTTVLNRPSAGIYSVTLILYKTSDDSELNRKSGSEPVHVGTTKESVAAFPRILDLGALQYGRYMHPVAIEISWDFYLRSTQVRKDHPWYMRIYTDNHKRYKGIEGAIYFGRTVIYEGGSTSAMGSPAGLVSEDGKYTIPMKVWCLNFGPDVEEGWDPALLGPPPVKEDYYWQGPLLDSGKRDWTRVAWEWIPDYQDMTTDVSTWRKLIGQDPFDTHYVSDSNPTGDFTLTSPFQLYVAYETSPTAVAGKYSTDLIIEIYSP